MVRIGSIWHIEIETVFIFPQVRQSICVAIAIERIRAEYPHLDQVRDTIEVCVCKTRVRSALVFLPIGKAIAIHVVFASVTPVSEEFVFP